MSIRRIGVLFGKELTQGSKSYFFIFAILAPLIFTLLVHLVFGTLFSGKPELGIVDYGRSQIVASLKHMQSIDLQQYASVADLKEAVAIGKRDAGMVLLENFDSTIKKGELTKLTVYVWGESLLKNRAMVGSAVLNQIRILSGKSAPVDITPVSLGDENAVSWKDRFLPLIVLMAIFISGFVVPATSLVDEKEKRTIGAILATPATQSDVFVAKGLMGVVASMAMGLVILILKH
ncbi:MAG: ABC transporter permease, partial [bacterium]